MKYKTYLILICLLLPGCEFQSPGRFSHILDRTQSLAVFSVPDCSEPHFYPSREFNWDRMWEGVTEGTVEGAKDDGISQMGFLGGIILLVRVPVSALVGGISKANEMPMKNHYRYILYSVFEGQNPGDRVAQQIHTNCKEKKPELCSQQVLWSDRERAEYMGVSLREKKEKMKVFSRSFTSGGNQVLLTISGKDYGLSGGTMKEPAACFFMTICAEWNRSEDGRQCYHRNYKYKSHSLSLNEWEANDSRILKEEYDIACQHIGDVISDDLLSLRRL